MLIQSRQVNLKKSPNLQNITYEKRKEKREGIGEDEKLPKANISDLVWRSDLMISQYINSVN